MKTIQEEELCNKDIEGWVYFANLMRIMVRYYFYFHIDLTNNILIVYPKEGF